MILVFDTETTGLPNWQEPSDDPNQPHIVDIACSLFDDEAREVERFDAIINPGIEIPEEVAKIHGITTEIAKRDGVDPIDAFAVFRDMAAKASLIVGHNVSFDMRMARILSARVSDEKWKTECQQFCTMRRSANICKILKAKARTDNDWKWPRLSEAVKHFFDEDLPDAHRARPDCDATARIFFRLREIGVTP